MLLANFTCAYRIKKDLLIVCYTKKEPFLQGFFWRIYMVVTYLRKQSHNGYTYLFQDHFHT